MEKAGFNPNFGANSKTWWEAWTNRRNFEQFIPLRTSRYRDNARGNHGGDYIPVSESRDSIRE
ncbi:hypothetical protein VNI00_001590 [Paramarasmius palmivorus]|uniref:Uncharacterized protein n=1 Tax=Paramarasmius palmivorus TaxID=297713 RepID=A0AAW0E396_9AGAR